MDVTIRREPIGVVAAIVPWNSQLFFSAVKVGPALAAGCTVVLKASEDGPAPLLAFAELIRGRISRRDRQHPDRVRRALRPALTSHPLVSRVAFTGGP